LRVDEEKNAYRATIMPPEQSETYPLTFSIIDYKNQNLKNIGGQLKVTGIELPPLPQFIFLRLEIKELSLILTLKTSEETISFKIKIYFLLLLILLLIILWLWRRRQRKKRKPAHLYNKWVGKKDPESRNGSK
jgi:hypothetical protein